MYQAEFGRYQRLPNQMYLAPVLELSAKGDSGIGSLRYFCGLLRLTKHDRGNVISPTMQENDTKRPLWNESNAYDNS